MLKKFVIVLICVLFIFSSEGPNSGATFSDDSGNGGHVAWVNPGNANASDDSYATVALTPVNLNSHYIKATNFGFSSVNGTVNGIVVGVERKSSVASICLDDQVRIVKGGTIGSTNKSTATLYTTSDVYEDHGSSSDLWGETWSASDITASNFGTAFSSQDNDDFLSATVSVDHIRITVYYTSSGGGTKHKIIGYGNGKVESFKWNREYQLWE